MSVQTLVARGAVRSAVGACALVLSGCPNPELAVLEPCTVSGVNLDAAQDGVDEVDLLFMIDNSGSMAAEQVKLASKLSQLVAVLSSGDREFGKPVPRDYEGRFFTPARSLHLGVVSSDLGRPPSTPALPGCEADNGGAVGNGLLQSSTAVAAGGIWGPRDDDTGRVQLVPGDASCARMVPTYIAFGEAEAFRDAADAAAGFQCVAKLGVDGCGIEQQIAAAYKALAPASEQMFVGPDKGGQGDRANAGFLRRDSVLAVVMVSDEDDCSISDTPAGWDVFTGEDVNTRCQTTYRDAPEGGALLSVSVLAERLLALRPGHPKRLVLASVVGVPAASSGVNYDDLDGLLALPDMQLAVEDGNVRAVCREVPDPLTPLPDGVSPGDAKPGRRFVELARAVRARGGNVVLRSICDPDYSDALDLVIANVAKELKGACLPRELALDAEGLVACNVVEILPLGSTDTCALPGRAPTENRALAGDPQGTPQRTACTLTQLPFPPAGAPPTGAGWYYDATTPATLKECEGGRRIVVTQTAPLRDGAVARVECFQSQLRVVENARGRSAINTPCVAGPGCIADSDLPADVSLPEEPMFCEPVSSTCQIPCVESAECPSGWECAGEPVRFCQNPTCTLK